MSRQRIIVDRGKVEISDGKILETYINTCVSICLYHPMYRMGGITHISRSRKNDTTPSGRYIKSDEYHYSDRAIPRLLLLLFGGDKSFSERSLRFVVAGGVNNEGPVLETITQLKKHDFILVGKDINKGYHRHVMFDVAHGIVSVKRKVPYTKGQSLRQFYLS